MIMMANIASNIFSALFLFPGAGLLILLSLVFICSFASYIGGKFYNAVKWVSFGIVISCVLICSLLWLVPKEILMPAYGVEAVDTSILALRFELTVVYLGIMCLCLFNFSWMRFLDKQSYVILLDQALLCALLYRFSRLYCSYQRVSSDTRLRLRARARKPLVSLDSSC